MQKVFKAVPAQIGRKFVYARIDSEERSRDLAEAVRLLCLARVMAKVAHTSADVPPIGDGVTANLFKPLFLDVGLYCRALGMNHRIAPTPQAKGKIERSMRTFQHRIVVVLKAEGVDNEIRANVVAREHIDFWCRTHVNDETGEVPDERMQRLVAEGKTRIRAAPNEKMLRLFLSRHIPRSVELGCRIEFMGRKWRITRTLKKTVWLAIRPENAGFYVLETRPDPTNPVVPRILGRYRF